MQTKEKRTEMEREEKIEDKTAEQVMQKKNNTQYICENIVGNN